MTLCRVITNCQNEDGYYLLFKRVFERVQLLAGQSMKFHSIQSLGIQGIVMDMDVAQYKGIKAPIKYLVNAHIV